MMFFELRSFLRSLRGETRDRQPAALRQPLALEVLEDRLLPSANSISGFVFQDGNNNGLKESGEQGIAGAPVQLYDSTHALVASTATDSNGAYSFATDPRINTAPATVTHTLSFSDLPTDWTRSMSVPKFDPSLGTLTSVEIINQDPITSDIKAENLGGAPATINATVQGTLTLTGPAISSLVTDLSANETFNAPAFDPNAGLHDFGPQIAHGVNSATLTQAGDLAFYTGNGSVSFTETAHGNTTASGPANLLFSISTSASSTVTVKYHYIPNNGLQPGNYTVVQPSDPPGFLDGQVTAGNVAPIPNSANQNSIPVTLGATPSTNNDFAELTPANLSGFVYVDANNSGIRSTNDLGINGVQVTLDGVNDLGAVHLSTSTASDGSYNFGNLRPGTYTLSESHPNGFLDGKDTIGSLGGSTSHDTFSNIVVGTGVSGTNNNFGELKSSSLSGFVYSDPDNNGVKEVNEPGISGVSVTLSGTDDLGHSVNATQTSGNNGSYDFTNLRPGSYTIVSGPATGFIGGKVAAGSTGGTTSLDRISSIGLGAGVDSTDNNFGELPPANVAGFVYSDPNNNGVKELGETGIAGVVVTLSGKDDQGNSVNLTQTSGNDGSYDFMNLRPGTYSVVAGPASGFVDGKDAAGSTGGTAGINTIANFNLGAGVSSLNNDFAELTPAHLTGFVYVDANNNGVKDAGETGIPNLTVTLTGTDDRQQAVSLSLLTQADGSYDFGNLRPGTYQISEAGSDGFFDGKDSVGSLGGVTSHDQFASIVLPVGAIGNNYNFGEQDPPPPPPPPPAVVTPPLSKQSFIFFFG